MNVLAGLSGTNLPGKAIKRFLKLRGGGTPMIYDQLDLMKFLEPTAGASDFRAKISQWPESSKESPMENVVPYFFTVTQLIRDTPKESQPSCLLIENVKNLLSINRGFDFLKLQIELDEIGYDLEWSVLDSAEVVPQHRERLFIIGHLRGRRTRKVFPICQNCEEASETNRPSTNTLTTRYSEAQGNGSYVVEGESKKVHQIGNISTSKSYGGNPQIGRVYGTDGLSPTLSTMQGGGRQPKIAIPVLTPDRIRKRQNGRRFKTNGEPEFTLTGQDRHGILTNDLRIRKLTPRECWRLQGFPDWAFDRAKAAGLSDSQLYKQAGNSVTVPVIRLIAEKMALIDETR